MRLPPSHDNDMNCAPRRIQPLDIEGWGRGGIPNYKGFVLANPNKSISKPQIEKIWHFKKTVFQIFLQIRLQYYRDMGPNITNSELV